MLDRWAEKQKVDSFWTLSVTCHDSTIYNSSHINCNFGESLRDCQHPISQENILIPPKIFFVADKCIVCLTSTRYPL